MKLVCPQLSILKLCQLFGKTRQAYYQASQRAVQQGLLHGQILNYVRKEREYQPKVGVIKLQRMLLNDQQISIGRDALYSLLRENNLLIRVKKKYRLATTNGNGESIYADLRKGLRIRKIHQLWSSDITYLPIKKGRARHCYATFIIDEYSHLIVGYTVSEDMTAQQTLVALQDAVQKEQLADNHELIFHTDRGSQFKSAIFQNFLAAHRIKPSMTEDGKPSDNPVSERLNGILKGELLIQDVFENFEQARHMITQAVQIYNQRRLHLSCELLTPQQAHAKGKGALKKLWK